MRSSPLVILGLIFAVVPVGAGESPFFDWPLSKAVQMLNDSAWAHTETFTRVVGGLGSGLSGEKEIFNTFYIRFLSAGPIRQAYARVQQIRGGYDRMDSNSRSDFDLEQASLLEMETKYWIVVALSFRSNDPNQESQVRRFFQSQTSETLKDKAFLSTNRHPQVEISAYFAPREEGVGAKFVFPRHIQDQPLLTDADLQITFELLGVPGADPHLRSRFLLKDMVVDEELVF